MHDLQELVRLHRMGTGCREVARLMGMSPNTERLYRRAFEAAGLLAGDPKNLPDLATLQVAVAAHRGLSGAPQQPSEAEPWREQIVEMMGRGARPKAIYDTLKLEVPGFSASLWSVKRLCRALRQAEGVRPEEVVIPVVTGPGEVAQVDFGFAGRLYDPDRGVDRKAWVFTMVLGHSRHRFDRIVFDQRTETWLALHVEAFEALGGVPETLVPDNLKAAVVRAAFGRSKSPELNRSYRELARHYGCKIDPTPPYAPKKKGKVEAGVKYVKQSFLKPRQFADIHEANRQLDRWVAEVAGQRIHGTTGRRPLEVFEAEEREALQPLPARPYVPLVWKPARVHPDCQIQFDGHRYPVPWRFIGKQVWVRATPRSVEIYYEETRIEAYRRGQPVSREILDRCLPDYRAELRHRSQGYWMERARALGPEVEAYIREVFDSDEVLSQLRTVQAMVTHLESFPRERARAACRRASYFGNYRYVGLRDILKKALDLEPLPTAVVPARGRLAAPRYARSPQELLQLPLEVTDEPN